MGPPHLDSNTEPATAPDDPHYLTSGGARNATPPRRSRRHSAAITRPDGRGFPLRTPRDESVVPRHDALCRETDARRAPSSRPPTTGEGFRPIAPLLSPAQSRGRSLHPASTTPPPKGTRHTPQRHHGTTSSPDSPLVPPPWRRRTDNTD
jgi:hypothetical protein